MNPKILIFTMLAGLVFVSCSKQSKMNLLAPEQSKVQSFTQGEQANLKNVSQLLANKSTDVDTLAKAFADNQAIEQNSSALNVDDANVNIKVYAKELVSKIESVTYQEQAQLIFLKMLGISQLEINTNANFLDQVFQFINNEDNNIKLTLSQEALLLQATIAEKELLDSHKTTQEKYNTENVSTYIQNQIRISEDINESTSLLLLRFAIASDLYSNDTAFFTGKFLPLIMKEKVAHNLSRAEQKLFSKIVTSLNNTQGNLTYIQIENQNQLLNLLSNIRFYNNNNINSLAKMTELNDLLQLIDNAYIFIEDTFPKITFYSNLLNNTEDFYKIYDNYWENDLLGQFDTISKTTSLKNAKKTYNPQSLTLKTIITEFKSSEKIEFNFKAKPNKKNEFISSTFPILFGDININQFDTESLDKIITSKILNEKNQFQKYSTSLFLSLNLQSQLKYLYKNVKQINSEMKSIDQINNEIKFSLIQNAVEKIAAINDGQDIATNYKDFKIIERDQDHSVVEKGIYKSNFIESKNSLKIHPLAIIYSDTDLTISVKSISGGMFISSTKPEIKIKCEQLNMFDIDFDFNNSIIDECFETSNGEKEKISFGSVPSSTPKMIDIKHVKENCNIFGRNCDKVQLRTWNAILKNGERPSQSLKGKTGTPANKITFQSAEQAIVNRPILIANGETGTTGTTGMQSIKSPFCHVENGVSLFSSRTIIAGSSPTRNTENQPRDSDFQPLTLDTLTIDEKTNNKTSGGKSGDGGNGGNAGDIIIRAKYEKMANSVIAVNWGGGFGLPGKYIPCTNENTVNLDQIKNELTGSMGKGGAQGSVKFEAIDI